MTGANCSPKERLSMPLSARWSLWIQGPTLGGAGGSFFFFFFPNIILSSILTSKLENANKVHPDNWNKQFYQFFSVHNTQLHITQNPNIE